MSIWDIALVEDGKPVVVYVKCENYDKSYIYRYGRWDGSDWKTYDILDYGDPVSKRDGGQWYSCGIRLTRRDPNIVYASVEIGEDAFAIQKFRTNNGGRTWTAEWQRPLEPSQKHFWPRVPRNAPSIDFEVFWSYGTYVNLRNYKTGIRTQDKHLLKQN